MNPLSEESSCGLVDPTVLGFLVIYSLGGHDLLSPRCVLVWDLFLNVSSYEEKTFKNKEGLKRLDRIPNVVGIMVTVGVGVQVGIP